MHTTHTHTHTHTAMLSPLQLSLLCSPLQCFHKNSNEQYLTEVFVLLLVLLAQKEDRLREQRNEERAAKKQKERDQKEERERNIREAEIRSYSDLMKQKDAYTSNEKISDSYEDDFMWGESCYCPPLDYYYYYSSMTQFFRKMLFFETYHILFISFKSPTESPPHQFFKITQKIWL